MTLDLRSLLIGAVLGAILAVPLAVAASVIWHANKQLDRERQSLALALGCGPTSELEFATQKGVAVVRCQAAPAKGSGD